MKNDRLKELAQRAKNRMKSGYGSEGEVIKISSKHRLVQGDGVKVSKINNSPDPDFYKKVIELINSDETYPMKKLIDESLFHQLDEISKERYFFEIVAKYQICKNLYEKECERLAR